MKHASLKPLVFSLLVVLLGGCASVSTDKLLDTTNAQLQGFSPALQGADSDAASQAKSAAIATLLASPLTQSGAVELSLLNSPALQRLLALSTADSAAALQLGRIANPTLSIERLTTPTELEIGRILSFGLLDLLTLPKRQAQAQSAAQIAQQQLALAVVDHVTQVRSAWVQAVGTAQKLHYARQTRDSAEASAELARRMQAVGNFNRLDRAKQQAYYADGTAQLATAQLLAERANQALVRLLGLTDAQATQLVLPERLPALPKAAREGAEIAQQFEARRLDLRLAQAQLDLAGKAQGLGAITTLTDVELGVRRDSVLDTAQGVNTSRRGLELTLRLPLFDSGNLRRTQLNAQTRAALHNLEEVSRASASHLRDAYSTYRTQYDLARHYQDEILPLRKTISDENLLRYFGMFMGVFDLLADSRAQISTVMQSLDAQMAFWGADAALQATVMGKPMSGVPLNAMPSVSAAPKGH